MAKSEFSVFSQHVDIIIKWFSVAMSKGSICTLPGRTGLNPDVTKRADDIIVLVAGCTLSDFARISLDDFFCFVHV